MPQIPLFVSSAKASANSTGSFSINFQPPLELPATAKNATIEVQQMSAPYTSPNISAALGNNQLVVQLPNSARDGFLTLPNSATPHRSVITIPSGLYGLDALEAEINHHPLAVSPCHMAQRAGRLASPSLIKKQKNLMRRS